MNQQDLLQRLCDALADLPVEALVTTGPAVAPASLKTSPNTTAVEFVAHDDVLPSARLLVTHAGHGTVAAGLTHGVPMLCVPMGRDQPAVAGRVAELGLGAVTSMDASATELRRSIAGMLADEKMRDRARGFARGVSRHPGMDEAVLCAESAAHSANP